jgi:exo-1,4-beta-D-glucosaminidase
VSNRREFLQQAASLVPVSLGSGASVPNQGAAAPADPATDTTMLLRDGWAIRSSADVRERGPELSVPGFDVRDWYLATVPTTVLSALVNDQVYLDPYFGINLRTIPGAAYPTFSDFAVIKMPPDSPFRHSWWYRTEFKMPAQYDGSTVWLCFDGINYRANVWMNGRQIASSEQFAGMWRLFNFDVTTQCRPGDTNALAVEVFPPRPRDLSITLVDWAPMPPDKEMGIWRDVSLRTTGPVALRYPAVFTKLDLPATDRAELTVRVELQNATNSSVEGTLSGHIESMHFSTELQLRPRETRVLRLGAAGVPQLRIDNPRLWWPAQLGPQNLYPLELQFEANGRVSDSRRAFFGIRQVTAELDSKGHRVFRVNGKRMLIRGAGYSFDLLLRSSPERQEEELKYVRDLNLNAIRQEGKLENDHFYDLCDRMGIVVLPGWCCCDQWENWADWDAENYQTAADSMRDQIRRLERHPSVFAFLYGSDFAPPPRVEKMYLKILKECDWPNPSIASASNRTTTVGPTGVKMTGPYAYVPPVFWYLDKEYGGAFGFNTETSPGAAIPPIESLRRMLPPEHLWPIDSWWDYHTAGMAQTLDIFTEALNKRYGPSGSAEEYASKAQVQAYETHRAMMEAYGRNKYTSTGIIQWMLNNAWPKMIWHLYDWYLRPGGSYFGVKNACKPLHIQYSYDDRSVVVVNSYYHAFSGVKATARVYSIDAKEKFSKSVTFVVPPDSTQPLFVLPELRDLSSTYFVDLELQTPSGLADRNFYWLSTTPETLDWERGNRISGDYHISTWTPTKTFADYSALNTLPRVDLDVTAKSRRSGAEGSTSVTLHNPTHTIAFAIRLKVSRPPALHAREGQAEGVPDDEILPVWWQDNYLSLVPGETREVTASYLMKYLPQAKPVVEVEGWNVNGKTVESENV